MLSILLLVAVAGVHVESCQLACQLNWDPVCGTDTVTYGNLCELEATACVKKMNIQVQHTGACVNVAHAKEVGCNVACQMNWSPVCGTDDETYGNLCQLQSAACLKKTTIGVQYQGECSKARVGGCNIACQMIWQPVCATNGVTYGNLCQLESEACLKKTTIGVLHTGECLVATAAKEAGCNIACQMIYAPVCGTNAVTYGNLCQLESDACMKKTAIGVQHAGECIDAAAAKEVGCNVACQMIYDPVCGTNAVTYGNLCQLEADACLKKCGVTLAHRGEC